MGTDGASGLRLLAEGRGARATFARSFRARLLAPIIAVAVCLAIGDAASAMAAPGVLDPSFGTGGVTSVDFGGQDTAYGEVIQPDGRIVVVGSTSAGANGGFDVGVARLTSTGALDPSFGSGGLVKLDFGNTDSGEAVALQPDGRIVVVGQTFDQSGNSEFAVARLNTDGSLDSTFGTNGEARFEFPGGTSAMATSVLVTPDSHIVVSGRTAATQGADDFAALRLNADGSLDPSFGSGGEVTVDFGGDDIVAASALTSDGRLVMAGETIGVNGGDFALARLNPDGSLDPSFGTGGKSTVDFGGTDDAQGVALQPDGKLVVGGETTVGSGDLAVARLNADGTLDPSFGAGGKATVDFGGHDSGGEVALQGDGSVVVAGAATVGPAQGFAVARLTAAGTPDPGFGTSGKTTVPFSGGDNIAFAHAVALQADGSIVLAGVSGGFDFALARLVGGTSTAGTATGAGTGSSTLSPAPNCGRKVPAYVKGTWHCVTAGAPISDGLTLIASEVPGLRTAGHGQSAARAALGQAIAAKRLGRAAAAAAFRATGRRLSTATFMLRNPAAAREILGSLGHGYQRLARVGDQAKIKTSGGTSHGSPATAVVVLRVGHAVAVLRLAVPAAIKGVKVSRIRRYAATLAGDYAATLANRLTRVLALTPWQRNLDQISPTGTVTKQVALRAFALQYESLPGTSHPKGATGAPRDGTLAIEMVAGVWSQLSSAQRSAVQADLGLGGAAGSAARLRPAVASVVSPDPVDQAVAQHWVQALAAKLPSAPPVTVKTFRSSVPLDGNKDTLANAYPVDANGKFASGGKVAYCQIQVAPLLMQQSAEYRIFTLAHEVFHCYEFALDTQWPHLGPWILEGMAEWAAGAIDPVSADDVDENLVDYLTTATKPLFTRAYDGVGFWGHADEIAGRGSLWAKIPDILAAGNASGADAFVQAGGTTPDFLQTWASAAFRLPSGGEPWNQGDPWAVSQSEAATPTVPITGGGGELDSAPYAMGLYGLVDDPDAPLVEIGPLTGTLRIANGPGGGDLGVVSQDRWLCTSGDCECPEGTTGEPPKSESVSGNALFMVITGGDEEGRAAVSTHSLDEYCMDENEPGGGGGSGGAGSGGITVYSPGDENGLQKLGVITQGSCQVSGGAFEATASGGGYTMHVHVPGATKPNVLYTIPSGSSSSYVTVNGYSSTAALKTGVGGVKFIRVTVGRKRRLRVSLGYDALFKGTGELILVPDKGGLVC